MYGGIRYLSRIDSSWELWAVFWDVQIDPVETRPIEREMEPLRKIAAEFDLTVH